MTAIENRGKTKNGRVASPIEVCPSPLDTT